MVWDPVFVRTLAALLFTVGFCGPQQLSKDVDINSLNEHVKEMDALLHQVQSHSKAQDQKYSAVLSSVLSQLTQTTDELEELRTSKNVTEELQKEVEDLKEDLENLKESNNDTLLDYTTAIDELAELKHSYDRSLIELETAKSKVELLQQDLQNFSGGFSKSRDPNLTSQPNLYSVTVDSDIATLRKELSQLNSTQTQVLISLADIMGQMNNSGYEQISSSKRPCQNTDIGFQANLTIGKTVSPSDRIIFDKINHNEGSAYNKTTGYFTAPVSGAYLFWVNIVYRSNKRATIFYIQTNNTIFGSAYGMALELYGTASATTIFYLSKGDRVWISSSTNVMLSDTYSSAGAVLIKQY